MRLVRRVGLEVCAFVDRVVPRLQGPRILIYHQVGSGRTHEMNVPAPTFQKQIEWLAANREIVSLPDAVRRRGERAADRLAVITFDDGYADVFHNAFPILQRRRLPFTLYLTTGPLESPSDFPAWPGHPLSWDEIRPMVDSGLMTVGAHTHTHPDLRTVDTTTIVDEIERSNEVLRRRLGQSPRHFTYPKGWWSPRADPLIRRIYDTATLGSGRSITAHSDVHTLNRVPVLQSAGLRGFVRKVTTGGRTENVMRRRLRGYSGP